MHLDRRALLLSLPGLFGAGGAWAQTADPQASERLDVSTDPWDRMRTPVTVNRQGPFPFTIDTGSDRTIIARSLAGRLALPPGPPVRIHSLGAVTEVPTAIIRELAIGGRMLTNLKAPVLEGEHLGALGFLGLDALAGQKMVMDFARERLTVGPSSHADDHPTDIVVRAKSRYGQLLLVDCSIDGADLYVVLDTGAAVTLGNEALRKTLERRRRPPQPVAGRVIDVVGAEVAVDLARMPRITIGGVQVRHLPIAYAEAKVFRRLGLQDRPAMFLGMDVLRHFRRVSLDFKAREVRFLLDCCY